MPEESYPDDVYLMFCGMIDQISAQRIMNGINVATQQNRKRVHLMLQSTGGNIGDGVCLHNYFEVSPIDLILYNVGQIASVAVTAYLGAPKRIAHAYSTFMVHSPVSPLVQMSTTKLGVAISSLKIDEARMNEILKSHVTISKEQWSDLRYNELWFTADDAVKSGLATEIGNFAPPKGTTIYTL